MAWRGLDIRVQGRKKGLDLLNTKKTSGDIRCVSLQVVCFRKI